LRTNTLSLSSALFLFGGVNLERRDTFIPEQTRFSVNDVQIASKYVRFRSSILRQFQKVNSCPEDSQIKPKQVAAAFGVILKN
jgi:hypothetical protein